MGEEDIRKFYSDCLIDVEGNAIPVMIVCMMKPKEESSWSKEDFERLLKLVDVYETQGLIKNSRN